MSWLSNIFKSRKPEIDQPEKEEKRELSLKELLEILEKKIQEKNFIFENEFKDFHKKMIVAYNNFSNSLEEFKKASGPSKIDDNVMKIAKSYRSSFIKSFNTVSMEFSKTVNYTIKDFEEYFAKCSSSLKSAESSALRYVSPLKEVFPNEMNRILKNSDKIDNLLTEIGSKISNMSSEFLPLINCLNLTREIGSQTAKSNEIELELSAAKSLLSNLNNKKIEIEKQLSGLIKSEGWSNYQRKIQEFSSIEKKRDEIRSLIVQSISPLDKAMKRLKKILLEENKAFEISDMLNLYINDPFDAFLKDKERTSIKRIISEIKSRAEKGALEIEGKKEQKILEKLSGLSDSFLSSLRSDYDKIEDDLKKIQSELDSLEIRNKQASLNEELKAVLFKISDAEATIKKIDSILEKLREKKSEIYNNLRNLVPLALGKDVTISMV